MKSKYTFENLTNDMEIRADYYRVYDRLISDLKKTGHTAVAIKHLKNKQRIIAELELADAIAQY